jgi:glycosyltransferase involved in cell wall biosynthesis
LSFSRNNKIAVFVPTLAFGGVERVMVNLAEGFSERGFDVDLVAPQIAGEFHEQLPAKVRLVHLNAGRVLTSLPRFIEYMRRERPSAVIAAMEHSSVAAIWGRAIASVPTRVIATVHTNLTEIVKHAPSSKVRLVPLVCRLFLHRADAIIAVSQGVADDLAEHAPKSRSRLKVIYNPIITESILGQAKQPVDHPWFHPAQPPVILGAGRLVPQKDFATLLRAFADVRQQRSARLLILGEGPERQRLEALAAELGVDQDVCLLGYEPNPYRYMSKAAVFVMSSAWEGFGNVLVEALASGAPVVATDCRNGPREILAAVGQGRLAPVGDAVALAKEISETLDSPSIPASAEALRVFTRDYVVNEYFRVVAPPDETKVLIR